jgi:GABA(A) receptor-associated protein
MIDNEFKRKHNLEERKAECARMLEKFPDKIPVIADKLANSNLASLDRKKYLLPGDILVSQFFSIMRKRLELKEHTGMFVFFGDKQVLAVPSMPMAQLYQEHKDDDGFLYCYYTGENTFGSNE